MSHPTNPGTHDASGYRVSIDRRLIPLAALVPLALIISGLAKVAGLGQTPRLAIAATVGAAFVALSVFRVTNRTTTPRAGGHTDRAVFADLEPDKLQGKKRQHGPYDIRPMSERIRAVLATREAARELPDRVAQAWVLSLLAGFHPVEGARAEAEQAKRNTYDELRDFRAAVSEPSEAQWKIQDAGLDDAVRIFRGGVYQAAREAVLTEFGDLIPEQLRTDDTDPQPRLFDAFPLSVSHVRRELEPYHGGRQRHQLDDLLAAIGLITDSSARAEMLLQVAPYRASELRSRTLDKAVRIAREIPYDFARAAVLLQIASDVEEPKRTEVLADVFEAASNIPTSHTRAYVFARLARALAPPQQSVAMSLALSAARAIPYPYARASTLLEVARHLPEAARAEPLAEALRATRDIGSGETQASILRLLEEMSAGQLADESLWAGLVSVIEHGSGMNSGTD